MTETNTRGTGHIDLTSRMYDPELSKDENFEQHKNYILVKITEDNLRVEDPKLIFRKDTKYSTKVDHVFENDNSLNTIFIDTHENSAHGIYLKNFKKYNPTFFNCEERVFFEALLIKHKVFGGEFSLSIPQTEKELGIKRTRRNTIIERFKGLEIISTRNIPIPDEQGKSITQFKVDVHKVIELIPKIYDKECADLVAIEDYMRANYL